MRLLATEDTEITEVNQFSIFGVRVNKKGDRFIFDY